VTQTSVLAVFAHPDDAELGCFGTLAGFGAAGFDLHILALTNGANSCSDDADFRPTEAKESAGVIGANLTIENFVDGGIEPNRETYACVADHISRLRPAVVITHRTGAGDHQDHDTAGRAATTMATRSPYVRLILQAEPPLVNTLFTPNFYIDVTAYIEAKLAAIAKYESEQGKPYMSEEAIRERGRWWARQAENHNIGGRRYYEAFYATKAKLDASLMSALDAAGRSGPVPWWERRAA
jgi:LmbE family N-acetylglucosaminyl deacetylase